MLHAIRPLPLLRPISGNGRRCMSVSAPVKPLSRRSWLYVPCSSERKLEKSISTTSDMIIYDLEDSIPPSKEDKDTARARLSAFIRKQPTHGSSQDKKRAAVRINAASTSHFESDIKALNEFEVPPTIVLPKVHSTTELDRLFDALRLSPSVTGTRQPIDVVASIESARGLWEVGCIAKWSAQTEGLHVRVRALLFAAEDFCADTGIIRTRGREELLYARSRMVMAAKAHGLEAIDMVCVEYKDEAYLVNEVEDGRRLGFTGKQAIHPNQVLPIQRAFAPNASEILRAAKIVRAMDEAHTANLGAVGIEHEGSTVMIDAPMILQATQLLAAARAAGLPIPTVE